MANFLGGLLDKPNPRVQGHHCPLTAAGFQRVREEQKPCDSAFSVRHSGDSVAACEPRERAVKAIEELRAVLSLVTSASVAAACCRVGVLGAERNWRYRPTPPTPMKARWRRARRVLSDQEWQQAPDVVRSETFVNPAPAEVRTALFDKGRYRGFTRMMDHRRPHVFRNNPFTESPLKPLKCQPAFLDRFASYEPPGTSGPRSSVLLLVEPRALPLGLGPAHARRGSPSLYARVLAARKVVIETAHAAHPERFLRQPHSHSPRHGSLDRPPADGTPHPGVTMPLSSRRSSLKISNGFTHSGRSGQTERRASVKNCFPQNDHPGLPGPWMIEAPICAASRLGRLPSDVLKCPLVGVAGAVLVQRSFSLPHGKQQTTRRRSPTGTACGRAEYWEL